MSKKDKRIPYKNNLTGEVRYMNDSIILNYVEGGGSGTLENYIVLQWEPIKETKAVKALFKKGANRQRDKE